MRVDRSDGLREAPTPPHHHLSPALRSRRDLPLLVLALGAAASSIAALLLYAVGWVQMQVTVSFVTLPGMVLLLVLGVWAGRTDRALLLNRLSVGAIGGVLGLVAYDLIRLVVQVALPLHFNAFTAISSFGYFITGQPASSAASVATGWAYHVTNGITFAIAYALIAGPARWWWGLIWGSILQLAMTAVYPGLFPIKSMTGFMVESVIGHAAYGSVIGLWCERHAVSAPAWTGRARRGS